MIPSAAGVFLGATIHGRGAVVARGLRHVAPDRRRGHLRRTDARGDLVSVIVFAVIFTRSRAVKPAGRPRGCLWFTVVSRCSSRSTAPAGCRARGQERHELSRSSLVAAMRRIGVKRPTRRAVHRGREAGVADVRRNRLPRRANVALPAGPRRSTASRLASCSLSLRQFRALMPNPSEASAQRAGTWNPSNCAICVIDRSLSRNCCIARSRRASKSRLENCAPPAPRAVKGALLMRRSPPPASHRSAQRQQGHDELAHQADLRAAYLCQRLVQAGLHNTASCTSRLGSCPEGRPGTNDAVELGDEVQRAIESAPVELQVSRRAMAKVHRSRFPARAQQFAQYSGHHRQRHVDRLANLCGLGEDEVFADDRHFRHLVDGDVERGDHRSQVAAQRLQRRKSVGLLRASPSRWSPNCAGAAVPPISRPSFSAPGTREWPPAGPAHGPPAPGRPGLAAARDSAPPGRAARRCQARPHRQVGVAKQRGGERIVRRIPGIHCPNSAELIAPIIISDTVGRTDASQN